MNEQKQYEMGKALQNAGFSVLDCLAIASCIDHAMNHCLQDKRFIEEYGTKIADRLKSWAT